MGTEILAYFDSSGKPNDPNCKFVTLAGYIGTPGAWHEFKDSWLKVLTRWNCPYFHMNEAFMGNGVFKGWTKEAVKQLYADLLNECFSPIGWEKYRDQFWGASCTINLVDYRKVKSEMSNLKTPEMICNNFLITMALKALPENKQKPYGKDGSVKLYFDKGESFMNPISKVWGAKTGSRLLSLVDVISCLEMREEIGIQAADHLAWSTHRVYSSGPEDILGIMVGYSRFLATPNFEQYYDYQSLVNSKVIIIS